MNKSRRWSYDECQRELLYIESIDARNPGHTFSYSSEVFATYCDMQAKQAHYSRYHLTARDIENKRDVALNMGKEG